MITMFLGLGASLAFGLLGLTVVYLLENTHEARSFFVAYTTSFKTLLSLGLIAGTAMVVFRSQDVIPQIIENAFAADELLATEYYRYKRRYRSARRSMTFAAQFAIVGFVIFSYCQFPLSDAAEVVMIVAACAQYALGVYIGRKLVYAGMMLHSLLSATVTRNLFRERELDDINTYVHIASTLTIIFVYVHVIGYYEGPFLYRSEIGESAKVFLILPVLIATPVLLIFNFYPRAVLRKLYGESIDIEVKKLQSALQDEALTPFEKRSHLIEFDKMCRDELRYSLQLTLSDLPLGITILVMILQPLMEK